MLIKQKSLRRYLRGWCRRNGVQYSRRVWLVRKQSELEREAERIQMASGVRLHNFQIEASRLAASHMAKAIAFNIERGIFGDVMVNTAKGPRPYYSQDLRGKFNDSAIRR